ncbi:uncharacterized protein CLUP02_00830 [Colletotrichum lupini]|uniref:Uncharacterized protein n=1 Tax=Colletotrichum lupini TaxID=145971 RepID=A0A9Q8W949_9PEZI|nr:uncharacterized protein CLUP02_00830 [Colletotrichum lupini]UQC74182.1 hypothetical protein CLUP02_00830 [Colletotrichum lupini]
MAWLECPAAVTPSTLDACPPVCAAAACLLACLPAAVTAAGSACSLLPPLTLRTALWLSSAYLARLIVVDWASGSFVIAALGWLVSYLVPEDAEALSHSFRTRAPAIARVFPNTSVPCWHIRHSGQ